MIEILKNSPVPLEQCAVWNSGGPYLYFRRGDKGGWRRAKAHFLLWNLEAFYLLIKLSKVEHEQAIYEKHIQKPSRTCFTSSDPHHDISRHIFYMNSNIDSDFQSGIYSDIQSGIYSDIQSGIYSDIQSDIYSNILSHIYSNPQSAILSGTFFLAVYLAFYMALYLARYFVKM